MTGTEIGVLLFTPADVGTILEGMYYIKSVRWVSSAAVLGDECVLQTASGVEFFSSYADGANFIDPFPFYRFFNGLKIQALDSGKLYVQLA